MHSLRFFQLETLLNNTFNTPHTFELILAKPGFDIAQYIGLLWSLFAGNFEQLFISVKEVSGT